MVADNIVVIVMCIAVVAVWTYFLHNVMCHKGCSPIVSQI